jgi:L-2-hydroxyglutarate oxidase LhgO
MFNTEFKGIKCNNVVQTNNEEIIFGTFINASGAYSDRVAHIFGVGINYRLVPFKGIYKKLRRERSNIVNGNIYPVPSLKNPFLGVHFTRSVSGDVYVGPTAIPSLGRENYGLFSGIDVEAIDFCTREAILFLLNQEFREVASSEIKKLFYKNIFADARKLVRDLNADDLIPSHKVGIRPQLIDWRKKELIMDYMIIKDENSIHILNATSPAFTSSMDFAGFVVNKYVN